MSDIIYTPPASSGGGQNPTTNYIPLNNGTSSFVDSNILNYYQNLIQTVTNVGGDSYGWVIDFIYKNTYIGDTGGIINGMLINLDDNNSVIKTSYAGNEKGLKLDFANEIYELFGRNKYGIKLDANNFKLELGDYGDGFGNGYSLAIDTNNASIYTYLGVGGNEIGLKLDFSSNIYYFGDFNGIVNGMQLEINDNNSLIQTNNGTNGFKLDILHNEYYFGNIQGVNELVFEANRFSTLGDWNANGNLTKITIDDLQKTIFLYTNNDNTTFLVDGGSDKITFTTGALNFVGAGLQSATSGGNSGKHLVITLNGNQYKIQLNNP